MISIDRGVEPPSLAEVRRKQLGTLRGLGRQPTSDDIDGYRVVAADLWKGQHYKCCYCERKLMTDYNDVEHYRPKAMADRLPGCTMRHGYWWLAFSWENLLFACPSCNRSSKKSRFPLKAASVTLVAEGLTPGQEIPLLIDPASTVNPVEHIIFVSETVGPTGAKSQWWARPRNQSQLGNFTIDVCGLNSQQNLDMRNDHFECVTSSYVNNLNEAFHSQDPFQSVTREFDRALGLLQPKNAYVALNYDALRSRIPSSKILAVINREWPSPDQVGK